VTTLPTAAIETVAAAFKGKRLELFRASMDILSEALENGAWLPKKASAQVMKGVNKGLTGKRDILRSVDPHRSNHIGSDAPGTNHDLYMLLRFAHPLNAEHVASRNTAYATLTPTSPWTADGSILPVQGLSAKLVQAWQDVCEAVHAACEMLDEARPKPVITAIGLSPKVTTTLKEMDLDIDLPSIRMAKIDYYGTQKWDEKKNAWKFKQNGMPIMEHAYFVCWTKGIKHNMSRFAHSGGCEACGKHIPSGRFVPVEANCRKNGLVSFWLGCDCARNIFGIKDLGLAKSK
jgi:hypothetical protein